MADRVRGGNRLRRSGSERGTSPRLRVGNSDTSRQRARSRVGLCPGTARFPATLPARPAGCLRRRGRRSSRELPEYAMRRLELPVALAFLLTPFSLAAQGQPTPVPQSPVESGAVAEPAQPQDQEKAKERKAKEQDKDKDKEQDGDAKPLVKEIKELADTVRSQMKEITKTAVSHRQKLEAQLNKLKEEVERARE